jgi:hypothetical protein
LLESSTRTGSHPSLELVPLGLQNRGPEQSDLLTLANAADYFGVIEIADSETHYARRVFFARLHEYEHGAACAPGPARSRSPCGASTGTASETTRTTARATSTGR